MRDGDTEGMQHFDGEIEKLIRAGIVDFEIGMTYSSNAGNLRLEMADFLDQAPISRLLQASPPHMIQTAPLRSKSSAKPALLFIRGNSGQHPPFVLLPARATIQG